MKRLLFPILYFVSANCITAAESADTPGAQAQMATPVASATLAASDKLAHGQFRFSDGSNGTFVETYVVTDSIATDSIIYTLADSTESSTETMTTTTNSDGTKTVDYSDLGFGATVAFKSTITYIVSKGGSAVGTGIFSTPNGTTGVLAAVVARNGQTSITSTDFTSSAGALTRQVRLVEKGGGSDAVKTLDVDAAGTLTTTTLTRFGGMHHQHP